MNISALFSKLAQAISRSAAFCARIPSVVFGNISWRPPHWWNRGRDAWDRLERAYPRALAPGIITLFALCCAAAWGWNWYEHRPQPHRVTVRVQPIEVTKLEKDLKFPRLRLYFSESAAQLEDLHKPLSKGVRLEPRIAGEWRWAASDILAFDRRKTGQPIKNFASSSTRSFSRGRY